MTVCNETQGTFMLKVDIESSTVFVAAMPLNLVKREKKAAARDWNWATQRWNNCQISTLKKESSAEYSSEIYNKSFKRILNK